MTRRAGTVGPACLDRADPGDANAVPAGQVHWDPAFATLEMTDTSISFSPEFVEGGCAVEDRSAFAFAGDVTYSNPTFDGRTLFMHFQDGAIQGAAARYASGDLGSPPLPMLSARVGTVEPNPPRVCAAVADC